MSFILDRWRGIGTRLYLALAFAVALTLISSGVGVYYFERSGDLNYTAESESVPALEAAWNSVGESERLRGLALEQLTAPDGGLNDPADDTVDESLRKIDSALTQTSRVPHLADAAALAQEAAYRVAGSVDALAINRETTQAANARSASLKTELAGLPSEDAMSANGLRLLEQTLQAPDQDTLDRMWAQFTDLSQQGLDVAIVNAGGGDGAFAARSQQIALHTQRSELANDFLQNSTELEAAIAALLSGAQDHSSETLGRSVESFDQGRVLLASISVISVIAATMAAWLWVGNAVVRRLSALSARMQHMAQGDLETPVPEVGRDEIGRLANALEHFRQQALEVQRLNLVEKLYEELQQANAELQRLQARLVAQEKLAALGELVGGVAHEMANPLSFVKNYSEGSLELYKELAEMLESYRDRMTEADASLLDELTADITQSLGRVSHNGGRALAIVERMRSLSAAPAAAIMTDLNAVLQRGSEQGVQTFESEWEDFKVDLAFDLDQGVGHQPLAEREFTEAVLNLISNACFAMQLKKTGDGDDYTPGLTITTQMTDENVNVRIRDNGTGIPDDVLPKIFNPFFTTQEGVMGTGLGLSISADVARRMGGDLTVETVAGEYTEFTLQLPIAAAEETPDNLAEATTSGTTEGA